MWRSRNSRLERPACFTAYVRQPRNPEGLRRLLTDVMVRNRRATTMVGLTRRVARTVTVVPTSAERALYAELSEFLRQNCRSGGEITRMVAQTLQMELGSSLCLLFTPSAWSTLEFRPA